MRCESTPSNGESRPALHETGSRRGPVPFVEDGAELLREALLQAADDGAREIESRWPAALARRDAGGALRLQGVPLAHGGFQHGRQALQSPRQPEIPCGPVAVARRNAGHAHEFLGFHILGSSGGFAASSHLYIVMRGTMPMSSLYLRSCSWRNHRYSRSQ